MSNLSTAALTNSQHWVGHTKENSIEENKGRDCGHVIVQDYRNLKYPLCFFYLCLLEYSGTALQPVPAGFGVSDQVLGHLGWNWQQDLDSGARKTQSVRHNEADRHRYGKPSRFDNKHDIIKEELFLQETTCPSEWRWIRDTQRCCQSAVCWEPSMVGRNSWCLIHS